MSILVPIFLVVAWTLLFLLHILVYSAFARVFDYTLPHAYLMLGVAASLFLLASIGVRTVTHVAADWFYYAAASWLGFVFILASLVLVYEAVHIASGSDSRLLLGTLGVLGVALAGYALFAGRDLVVKSYTVPVAGLASPIRVVHLSDIHVGTVHQTRYLERIVEATNALHPDLVLITGDLFDGSAPIDADILRPLNGLSAPAFFSNGNHEMYEGLDRVRATLAGTHLRLLENEATTTMNVQVIGVNDRQSLTGGITLDRLLSDMPSADGLPRILMYHSPADWAVARAHGVALMLSGHTHDGQIFPFTLLVRLFFPYLNGLYSEQGASLHVSPGTGTWGPPMRLGSRNQVTLLELVPRAPAEVRPSAHGTNGAGD